MVNFGIRVHKSYEQMGFKQSVITKEVFPKKTQEDSSFAQILANKIERGCNNGR